MKYLSGVCAAALFIAGCASMSGEEAGTYGGAILGGLLGSQVGDGTGQVIATAGGAVGGALIGRKIGQYLDKQDQKQLAEATGKTAATCKPESFDNEDTGVSGQTECVEEEERDERVEMAVKKDRVEEVPPLELIGEPYAATTTVNVRVGPGTDYKKGGQLAHEEAVTVAGKVQGESWYMISQDGAGSGFVHTDYLTPASDAKATQEQLSSRPQQQEGVTTAQADVTRECRTVEQQVTLESGETKTETVEACRGPNGWEVQS